MYLALNIINISSFLIHIDDILDFIRDCQLFKPCIKLSFQDIKIEQLNEFITTI